MNYQQQPWSNPGRHEHTIELKQASRMPWFLLVLLLGGAGYGAYWGLKERGRLMGRATTAEVAAATAETAKKTAEQEKKQIEIERDQLLAAKQALEKSVEEKSSELAELKGTQDKLQDKMKDEIARGDILLTTSGGRLRVDLVDKILFESGDAHISKRGEGVLGRVGAVLKEIEDKQIQVSGHTDDNPISTKLKTQFPTNWELSVARATNVVRFLQEKATVPPDRLAASGYGEHQALGSNKTAKGRARNRRIEILLLPGLAPKKISERKLKAQAQPEEKAQVAKKTAQ